MAVTSPNRWKPGGIPDLLLPLLLLFLLARSAGAGEGVISLSEHFPLGDGLAWRYNSNLGEVKSTVAVEGDRVTVNSRSRRLDIVQVYLISPEGVLLTSARSDALLFSSRRTYHPFLLRFPAAVTIGQTWEWQGKEVVDRRTIVESRVKGIVEGREKVTVPAGEFDCLKVTVETVSNDGTVSSSTQWLASGVGIVKAEVEIDAGGISGFIISLLGFDTYFLELEEMTGPGRR
jgi:hypothetical protein